MTHERSLEGSSYPPGGCLFWQYVDLLRQEREPVASDVPAKASDVLEEIDFFGEEMRKPVAKASSSASISVIDTALAALLADNLSRDPELRTALAAARPIVCVQAPDERCLTRLSYVLRTCVLGRERAIVSEYELDAAYSDALTPHVSSGAIVLKCDGERRDRAGIEHRALAALSYGVPTILLSTDIDRNIPRTVLDLADRQIVLRTWTPALLSSLLEACTGERIKVENEQWIPHIGTEDLQVAITTKSSATDALDRLRIVVERRSTRIETLPNISDLHGYGEAKAIALGILQDLEDYRQGRLSWADMPRGLLLGGPPGTGKSFFARCFASSASLPLVVGSMATWQSAGTGHLGDCLAAMKRSFREARSMAPAVLFIDELDSVGNRSQFHPRHRDYSTQVVNALLEELDGATDREGVVVLAATNDIGRIDPAVLRPGRIDRIASIDLPSTIDLIGIFRTVLRDDLRDEDLRDVALEAHRSSGASVSGWVRQARGAARRANRKMRLGDLLDAIRDGRPRMPPELRRRIAIHEAAHVVSALVLGIGTVVRTYLHPNGGMTETLRDSHLKTRTEVLSTIVHLLAGRAAEKRFLGAASTGAGGSKTSDLALATELAASMEASWGLGRLGPVWLGVDSSWLRTSAVPGVLRLVHDTLTSCEGEADRLIELHHGTIQQLAGQIDASGYLEEADILAITGTLSPFQLKKALLIGPTSSGLSEEPKVGSGQRIRTS